MALNRLQIAGLIVCLEIPLLPFTEGIYLIANRGQAHGFP
jgi:hypothetical protein